MPVNLEYSKLVDLLKKSDNREIYEELMKKEENVLDTINRVVNYSNEKEVKSKEFLNMSLDEIIHKFFWNIKLIFGELLSVKTVQDFSKIVYKDDRRIYIGLLLVIISIFLFFVIISK
jgi:hypothetical protein